MFVIRKAEERDQSAILSAAKDVGVFTAAEVACVDELLDIFLHQPDNHDYTFIVCSDEHDRLLGFACYGPTPLTEGTYDLYWLCVSKSAQGKGAGAALLEQVEKELSTWSARMLIAETSSTPSYDPARSFYEHHGFLRCACIRDFYRLGDDLIIYAKYFTNQGSTS